MLLSCIVAVVLGQESASEVIPEFRWATRHSSRLEEEQRMAGATQNMYNSGIHYLKIFYFLLEGGLGVVFRDTDTLYLGRYNLADLSD